MRFYPDVEPMTWLERFPSALTHACVVMLPRLEAAETIAKIEAAAAAAGHFSSDAAETYAQALERAARADVAPATGPGAAPHRKIPDPSAAPAGQRAVTVRRIPWAPPVPAQVTLTDGV